MRIWQGIFLVLIVVGCTKALLRQPAQIANSKPRHFIFLIHGIAGDPSHFGQMADALGNVLKARQPEMASHFYSYKYETGRNDRTTDDFAKGLADFVALKVQSEGGLQDADKISFIMHSQGGIVGTIFMFHSFLGDQAFHPELASHISHFVTLGTPFWGSKAAKFAMLVKSKTWDMKIDPASKFGILELKDMALDSDKVLEFRKTATAAAYQGLIETIKKQVKLLNVGAVVPELNFASSYSLGGDAYEDDTAVLLPSSQFNFIYSPAKEEEKALEFAPFRVVKAIHLTPFPERETFYGIAQIPKICVADEECSHEPFQIVKNHFLGRELPPPSERQKSLTGFLVDGIIRAGPGHALFDPATRVDFGIRYKTAAASIDKETEPYSRGQRIIPGVGLRFFVTGWTKRPQERVVIRLTTPKGLKFLKTVTVRPTYSTFVEIDM